MTYLLACNLVVQHIISCNWVLPVGNIFIIIIIIIIIINVFENPRTGLLRRARLCIHLDGHRFERLL
jgi:hypothetical protein